jgi:phospholipase/carboxylesterase
MTTDSSNAGTLLLLPPSGRHWYIDRQVGYPDPGTFLPTFDELAGHVDSLLAERELSWEQTALGGFSQGAVMSWALGLGGGRPRPAGIVALSGFVPTVDGFGLDLSPAMVAHARRATSTRS